MNEFKHVSASQIKTYKDCPRKWYFQKIVGLPTPSTASTDLGKEVHSVIEAWLRDGIEIPNSPIGEIAKAGLPLLPPRTEDLSIELALHEDLPIKTSPVDIVGYIDVIHKNGDEITIIDHKTTSSKKYTKKSVELSYDIQLNIYARAVFENYEIDSVSVSHVYYGTKEPFWASSSSCKISRQENQAIFDDIVKTIDKMKEDAKKEIDHVERDESACFKYGGCPFRSECLFKKRQSQGENDMSNVDFMAKLGLTAPSETAPTIVQPSQPTAPTVAQPSQPKEKQIEKKIEHQLEQANTQVPPYERRMLFIGCLPQKAPFQPVSIYEAFRSEIDGLCRELKVSHLSQVDYGKGWSALQAVIASKGWSSTHLAIFIDPMSDEYTRVGALLIANAGYVTRRV